MKWRIEYGMCDGTGPYTEEVEADDICQALGIVARKHGISDANLNSIVPCPMTKVRKGATFDEWWEANGDARKFKFIAQNIIKWIEEAR